MCFDVFWLPTYIVATHAPIDIHTYIQNCSAGGLGSCGAPNDGGIHQNFHFVRQGYQRTALGWHRNVLQSKSPEEYEVNKAGEVKLSIALPVSLESDVYALQCIKEHERGKLTMWAWLSRGYSTMQDIADWHFGGDLADAQRFMGPVEKGSFAKYVQLRELPVLNLIGEHESHAVLAEPDEGFLKGERVHIWFVDRGSEGMIPLPHWSSIAIECSIAQWRHEEKTWNQKIAARCPKALTPAQQKQYDSWLQSSTRRIVLDQQCKASIKHPSACSKSYLMKHGVLLEP